PRHRARSVAPAARLRLRAALPPGDRRLHAGRAAARACRQRPSRGLYPRPHCGGSMTASPSRPLLEVRDLARSFQVRRAGGWFGRPATLHAVDGVSFDLRPGRTLGLVGESGCGKTTTARLVLGVLSPTGGAVRFEDAPVPAP